MLTPQDIQSLGGLLDKGALGETEEPRDAGLPSEYVVDQLDYAYIKDCSDAVELTKLLRVLRSGREGFYPDLERAIVSRIEAVDPSFKQQKADEYEQEKLSSKLELEDWIQGMKAKEQGTVKSRSSQKELPIAVKTAKISADSSDKTVAPSDKNNKIKTSEYYQAWDKFDVDAELDKLDSQEPGHFVPTRKASKLADIPPVNASVKMDISVPSETSRSDLEFLADIEKNKGNEVFKAGEYDEAVAFYTRSLRILERAHVYTNRAAAFLKLKNFERAEKDSSAAIELNDAEFMFKGYIRRAEARRKRGKLWEALQDAESALKLDVESVLALKLRDECEREYKSVEGDLAKETTTRAQPKTRLDIVEMDEHEAEVEVAKETEINPTLLPEQNLGFSTIQIEDVDDDEEEDFNFDDLANEEPCIIEEEQHVAEEGEEADVPPVITELQSVDHLVPQSSIQLENTWNSLRHNMPAFSKLIVAMAPDTLYQLAKGVHETDVISDILGALTVTQDTNYQREVLTRFTQLPRFTLILKFMSRSLKSRLSSMVDSFKDGESDTLKKQYNLV